MTSAQEPQIETCKWDTLPRFRARGRKKKSKASLFGDGAQLAQGFPTEARLTDRERGTPQCLALEHRGCANWTSGSVASVQINMEAAQESSGTVRGIGEASHPPKHAHTHGEWAQIRMHAHKHIGKWNGICGYAKEPFHVTWSYSEAPG